MRTPQTPKFDGRKIALKRQALDMTQEELAEASGVSRHTIMRMEKGAGASLDGLGAVCAVLKMSVADVFNSELANVA